MTKQGNWEDNWNANTHTVGSRSFSPSRSRDIFATPVTLPLRNDDGYDILDLYVGRSDELNPSRLASLRFTILGDDDVLYQSRYLKSSEKADHIRVDIRKYRSVSIRIDKSSADEDAPTAVIGEPNFFRMPRTVPMLLTPKPQEEIRSDSELSWEGLDGVSGYLLELQCVDTKSDADGSSPLRFQTIQLSPSSNSWKFEVSKMPRGRWRWRVHAISGKKVSGEMGQWRYFDSI